MYQLTDFYVKKSAGCYTDALPLSLHICKEKAIQGGKKGLLWGTMHRCPTEGYHVSLKNHLKQCTAIGMTEQTAVLTCLHLDRRIFSFHLELGLVSFLLVDKWESCIIICQRFTIARIQVNSPSQIIIQSERTVLCNDNTY